MSGQQVLIEELDRALSSRTLANRADALRKVTDFFLAGAARYSEEEVDVFDEVMLRLTREIEEAVRATVAARLAKVHNAPGKLMRALAADQAIEVAGPVLQFSKRLDDPTLVATARTCSQQHLLAISQRETVNEPVSDVLIERGDRIVTLSTVNNAGARFSPAAHAVLVARSKDDDELATGVWSRTDVPRHHLLRLFLIASDNVRRTLEAADRGKVQFIRDMMVGVSNELQDQMRGASRDYLEAHRRVSELHRRGGLDEAAVKTFAMSGQFEATTVALSILCDLPIGACERAMVQNHPELLLMLARAVNVSWNTMKPVLRMRAGPHGTSQAYLEQCLASFNRINPETARKALQFMRLRERAAIASPELASYQ